jgi:hypothetical protein
MWDEMYIRLFSGQKAKTNLDGRAQLYRLRKKSMYEGYGLQPLRYGNKNIGL